MEVTSKRYRRQGTWNWYEECALNWCLRIKRYGRCCFTTKSSVTIKHGSRCPGRRWVYPSFRLSSLPPLPRLLASSLLSSLPPPPTPHLPLHRSPAELVCADRLNIEMLTVLLSIERRKCAFLNVAYLRAHFLVEGGGGIGSYEMEWDYSIVPQLRFQ